MENEYSSNESTLPMNEFPILSAEGVTPPEPKRQGRHKMIRKPEQLYNLWVAYKHYTLNSPRSKWVLAQKLGRMIEEELRVPFTKAGFFTYINDALGFMIKPADYFYNRNNEYSEFSEVCAYIMQAIEADQIEGGMVGQYNASITQRLNNLSDKQEVKATVEEYSVTLNLK